MARNPFLMDKDPSHPEDSEFGFGRGRFPDPRFDYSDNGTKSRIPIADPDGDDQLLTLAMIYRTDVSDPNDKPSPYVTGNTDRFGAQPPLVRETKPPAPQPRPQYTRSKMEREW